MVRSAFRPHRTAFVWFVLLCLLACGQDVQASPWLLKPGHLVVVGQYDFETAKEEFLGDRSARAFPLQGEYQASTLTTRLRYGLLSDLELELSLPIKQISYHADPVIFNRSSEVDPFDFYQENVIHFSQEAGGLADVQLAARWQLFRNVVVGAAELRLKTPTGYQPPSGTFGDAPKDREAYLEQTDTLVSPENVTDDVTLGDGQLDVSPSLKLGWASSWGTFARVDLGYKLRFGGAGDQVIAGARLGQRLNPTLLIYGGADGEYAVEEGRTLGISVRALNPELPAVDYEGLSNLELKELTFDRDQVIGRGGILVRLTESVEFNLGYSRTLWGRNVALVQAFTFGIGVQTQIMDTPGS